MQANELFCDHPVQNYILKIQNIIGILKVTEE